MGGWSVKFNSSIKLSLGLFWANILVPDRPSEDEESTFFFLHIQFPSVLISGMSLEWLLWLWGSPSSLMLHLLCLSSRSVILSLHCFILCLAYSHPRAPAPMFQFSTTHSFIICIYPLGHLLIESWIFCFLNSINIYFFFFFLVCNVSDPGWFPLVSNAVWS